MNFDRPMKLPFSNYAFFVAASSNYIPGLVAMFNSLKRIGNTHDVVLISFRLPKEFIQGLDDYPFNIIVIESEGENQIHQTAIERFRVVCEFGWKYDAVCLLDADMWIEANVDVFFKVASKGLIVTGSNGMIINFHIGYQEQYDVELDKADWPYPQVHTTVPIFIDTRNFDWFDLLYKSRRVDHWDDFLYLNILGIKLGKYKKMICMPPYAFTGIHHWQMKPETGVIEKGDLLLSGTEEQIYMVHGKWWDKGWLQDLLPTMEGYWHDEEISFRGQGRTHNAINSLLNRFRNLLTEGDQSWLTQLPEGAVFLP